MQSTTRIVETRRLLAGLALVSATLALVACGDGGGQDPVAEAATKSLDAGGVRLTTSVTLSFPNGSRGVIRGRGAFDGEQGVLSVDMSDLLQDAPLPNGSGNGIVARYLTEAGDRVMYLHIPVIGPKLPRGKTWIRIDLQRAGADRGLNFNKLLGPAGQNPAEVLGLLHVSGGAKKVGRDTLAGVKVTQYRATIDLRQALLREGVSRAGIEQLLAGGAAADVPVRVWIGDADGLVHQVRTIATNDIHGQAVSVTTLTRTSRWGTRVSVLPPPADRVYYGMVDGVVTGGAA
jgi:hypothetical protein